MGRTKCTHSDYRIYVVANQDAKTGMNNHLLVRGLGSRLDWSTRALRSPSLGLQSAAVGGRKVWKLRCYKARRRI